MECKELELLYGNVGFLRFCTGSDGYSASWRRYDIAPHEISPNFLTNCLRPWMKHTIVF